MLLKRQPDGTLCHTVKRKPTHTDFYLYAKSEHHPVQKRIILFLLIGWAKTVCDPGSLEGVMDHLKKTFKKNGYSTMEYKEQAQKAQGSGDQTNIHGHDTIYADDLWKD